MHQKLIIEVNKVKLVSFKARKVPNNEIRTASIIWNIALIPNKFLISFTISALAGLFISKSTDIKSEGKTQKQIAIIVIKVADISAPHKPAVLAELISFAPTQIPKNLGTRTQKK